MQLSESQAATATRGGAALSAALALHRPVTTAAPADRPTRALVFDLMRACGRPTSAPEIAETLGFSYGTINLHQRTLETAGLIWFAYAKSQGKSVPTKYYEPVPGMRYPAGPEGLLLVLLEMCSALAAVPDGVPKGSDPTPVRLDAELIDELLRIVDTIEPNVRQAARRAVSRSSGPHLR